MKKGIAVLILLIMVMGSGCKKDDEKIIIAEQYGLAYAPLQIMKEMHILEDLAGADRVEWVQLGNTTAIREAMLSGDLDVGFMGIPPFLIGYEQGMEWKMISGLSESPLGLVTRDDSISSLEELRGQGKIALPQPGSIQHILLAMAAKKELGDSKAFDQQLISLKHPDGYQAMLAGNEVVAHFTSPPYLFQELENESFHQLVSGQEAMGEAFTFIVGACREDFYSREEDYQALKEGLEKAMTFIAESKEETVAILSEAYNLDEETTYRYLYDSGMVYTEDIKGSQEFVDFMNDAGYIKGNWDEKELIWNE